jgi:RHS repeat-associated protein
VTLQWAAAPTASYCVCWDTTNNGMCDTGWQWNGTGTSRVVAFPESATYYWQVKTSTGTEADDGAWWSMTVTGPPLFTKIAPANGASGLGSALTLQWTAVPDEGYWVCWDTVDNGTCDTTWWPNGAMTAKVLSGLTSATYYWPFDLVDPRALRATLSEAGSDGRVEGWQVRTSDRGVPADHGAWGSFSVSAPALLTKQAPATGATGLGSTVTLQWTAVPEEGYGVCWDTTDNGTCDTTWVPNGATVRVVSGLTTGTYYWQVKTAGGGVLADNVAWHHFTVAAAPGAAAAAPLGRDGRPFHRDVLVEVVATGCLALAALTTGGRRRRRVVGAAVVLGLLVPATALAQSTTQIIEYYTTDALGSVRAVTKKVDGTWQVVSRHDFMPFGEEVAPPPPPSDKRLFTGKERDSETGLDYFEARYLRASVGRFTTVDPAMTFKENLADPRRWNRYGYVRNNPLRYTDPNGRCIYPGSDCAQYLLGGLKAVANIVPDLATMVNQATNTLIGPFTTFRFGDAPRFQASNVDQERGMFAAQVAMLVSPAMEIAAAKTAGLGASASAGRDLGLAIRDDVLLAGGRSGERVKDLVGPANSAVRGSAQRVFVTNDRGQVVLDITPDRVKPVVPGQGFGPKRTPTKEELELIARVHAK